MPQLDPTWFASQLFWLAVCVTFLFAVLKRSVLPPLVSVLERRARTREEDIGRAQTMKSEAERMLQEYERVLADARSRAQGLFTDAELKNKQAMEAALAEFNHNANAKMAEAEQRIERNKQELLKSLEPSLSGLAAAAVEKLTGARPGEAQAAKAVQHTLHS